MKLRPYQQSAIDQLVRVLHSRPILVAPTGSGKTVMGTALINNLQGTTLWVAHRRELIHQAADHLKQLGLHTGIIMASEPRDGFAKVQVASVQTLFRREVPENIQLIVVDECHHATATTYAELFKYGAPVVGLTATPFRLDGKPLGDMFGEIVVAAPVADLVEQGYLHEPKVWSHGSIPDTSKIKITAGDYNLRQLGDAVNDSKLIGDLVQHWFLHADDRRTVCFAVDVKHSKAITQEFINNGVAAEHLDGTTPKIKRDEILYRLRHGPTRIVSNCMVLTEGWDLPALECAVVARPTASLNLHIQMIGRIMRATEGKDGCIVLDHAGNHIKHGAVTQELTYSLDGPVKRPASDALGLRRCQECGAMYPISAKECPECGAEPDIEETKIEHEVGDLQEFDPSTYNTQASIWRDIERQRISYGFKPGWSIFRFEERLGFKPQIIGDDRRLINASDKSRENKQAVYEWFVSEARLRGYADGWASHRYRDVFGVWPTGFVEKVRGAELTERYATR